MNLLDRIHQLIGVIDADFYLACRAELGRLPEDLVKVREVVQVGWLEVVRPEDEQFLFGQLSLLFLDGQFSFGRRPSKITPTLPR